MIMARGDVLERIERAPAPPATAPEARADRPRAEPRAAAALSPVRVRDGLIALSALGAYLLLTLLDRAAYKALFVGHANLNSLEDAEWYKLLRVIGSLWTWSLIAIVFIAHDTGRAAGLVPRGRATERGPAWERGVRIFAAAVVAGLLAELAKVVVGRWRPIDTDGYYVYTGLAAGFLKPANGMPSSHAAVAFGAALTLAAYVPRATGILIAAAAGCCLSRVLSGAHFITDTFVGAAFGYAGARLVRPGGWAGANAGPSALP